MANEPFNHFMQFMFWQPPKHAFVGKNNATNTNVAMTPKGMIHKNEAPNT